MTTPTPRASSVWTSMLMVLMLAATTQSALAQTSTTAGSIETMFTNATTTWTDLINLVVGVSFLGGIFLGCVGLIKLKDVGDGRTQLKTPIWCIIIGAALISMPSSIDMITQTLSLGSNTGTQLLSQSTTSSIAGVSDALTGIMLFIKLLGHVAFFRGMLILKDYGGGAQGATLGRGLTHLLGGAAAINIQATTSLLAATFFTGVTLPGGLGSF